MGIIRWVDRKILCRLYKVDKKKLDLQYYTVLKRALMSLRYHFPVYEYKQPYTKLVLMYKFKIPQIYKIA